MVESCGVYIYILDYIIYIILAPVSQPTRGVLTDPGSKLHLHKAHKIFVQQELLPVICGVKWRLSSIDRVDCLAKDPGNERPL